MPSLSQVGRWATVVAFLAISWLAIQPSNIAAVDEFNDKSKHVFAFFVLGVGLLRYWRLSWPVTGLALLAFGIAIEFAQYFIPGRTASVWDVLADLVGIWLAILVRHLPHLHPAK